MIGACKMEYKLDKDKKIKDGRIVECIVMDCKNPANITGFCWKHYDQEQKELKESES